MRTRKEILLQHLQNQTRNWTHWVSAGLALGRISSLPPLLGSMGLSQTGTVASWCLPTILGLGAHHTLSGATTVTYAPALSAGTARVKEGDNFYLAAVINSQKEGSARAYTISGDVPAGITPQEGQVSNGTTLMFTGIPTQTGTFSITIQGWEKTGGRGEKTPSYTFTLIVEPNATNPAFSAQPGNAFANWGGTAQFSASVSNATSLQWRRDGVPLLDGNGVSGSGTPTLSLDQLTSADHGASFDLIASGADGSLIISDAAQLDVNTSRFELWREQTFAPSDRFNDAVSGPNANPEGDARDNALEFALNSSPEVVDPMDPFTRTIRNASGSHVLELSFAVNPSATESDLQVEQANAGSFGTWEALSAATIDRTTPGRWIVNVPLGATPAFVRLRATP